MLIFNLQNKYMSKQKHVLLNTVDESYITYGSITWTVINGQRIVSAGVKTFQLAYITESIRMTLIDIKRPSKSLTKFKNITYGIGYLMLDYFPY